ncbi:hypothetical protein EYF80_031285 [Liparis tanakae]|uniref:Uncharacterized protein n=1 Tax=Liparis tanakae TaxID=230148 RepID=A0A4Z2H0R6_9TELE|nr:hypothetical protein EYF80_031285 [Liparis tanakae]
MVLIPPANPFDFFHSALDLIGYFEQKKAKDQGEEFERDTENAKPPNIRRVDSSSAFPCPHIGPLNLGRTGEAFLSVEEKIKEGNEKEGASCSVTAGLEAIGFSLAVKDQADTI